MKCCDREQDTPYCAICGKQLIPLGTAIQLLAFITNAEAVASKWLKAVENEDAERENHETRLKKKIRNFNKWHGWRKVVQSAIEKGVK